MLENVSEEIMQCCRVKAGSLKSWWVDFLQATKFSGQCLETRGVSVGAHSPLCPLVFAWVKQQQGSAGESEPPVPPSTHRHFTTSLRCLVLIAFKHRSVLLSVPIDSNYTCLTATGTEPLSFAQGFYVSLG